MRSSGARADRDSPIHTLVSAVLISLAAMADPMPPLASDHQASPSLPSPGLRRTESACSFGLIFR